MAEYIIVGGELKHYGVKGMKWGVRRAKLKEAKSNYKRTLDREFSKYEKGIASVEKGYKRGQNLSKKDQAREDRIESTYSKAAAKAKTDYKNAKHQIKRDYLESRADQGAKNYYKNPIKMNRQLKYKQKLYDFDTRSMTKGKNLVDKLATRSERSLNRPAISITGRETTAGKAAAEQFIAYAGVTAVSMLALKAAGN